MYKKQISFNQFCLGSITELLSAWVLAFIQQVVNECLFLLKKCTAS